MFNVFVAELPGTAGAQGFAAGARAPAGPTLAPPLLSVCPSVCHIVSDTKYRAVSL